MTAATQTCPVCGKPVDPLRARAVGVRGGKVVAYDSVECQRKAEAESRPIASPQAEIAVPRVSTEDKVIDNKDAGIRVTLRTPVKGIPVVIPASADSGPIITITREESRPVESDTDGADGASDASDASDADDSDDPPDEPEPAVPRVAIKRHDTRPLQPPEDYDDSDLGPPNEDAAPSRRSPILLVLIVVVLAAAAAAAAFKVTHG